MSRIVDDLAEVAGCSHEDAAERVHKIQLQGKAYELDLLWWVNLGIPIHQWIASEMVVSQDELTDLLREGKVTSAVFLTAVEKNIGGAAEYARNAGTA